jgi:gliding motility-associated-like protein
VDDTTYPTQTPSTTVPTVVGDVTDNDTLNGVLVTSLNTDVTPVTSGPLSIDADGNLSLAPNTPSGTYTIVYQLCEVDPVTGLAVVPANCDTATATVVVLNPIVANDDSNPTPINGYTGGVAIPTVLENDTLNGVLVTASQVTITLTSTLPTGITFDTTTGAVGVSPGTPAGTYTFTYLLCEVGANPANCDPATVTVTVVPPPIIAEDDNLTTFPINGFDGGLPGNIFDNNGNGEDLVNGLPVLADEVIITLLNDGGLTGVVIDNNGDIIVPAGTPAGSYTLEYQICDVLNPTNCDTAFVFILVEAPVIDAVDNDFSSTPINSATGGSVSIFDNDTLNGDAIDQNDVTFVILNNGGIDGIQVGVVLNSNGVIQVPAGTPPGTYVLTYQICQVLNPTVCDVAFVTIVVLDPCDFDNAPDSCDIIVFNTISNNNDGINDYFLLQGIERFPNNSVCIFNRWGVKVYEVNGYDNDSRSFKGISEGRVTYKQDSELPEGTYFYVLKYTKSNGVERERAGYLYINR